MKIQPLVDAAAQDVGRQRWLDIARGLAIVSMVVAHTAPAGGVFAITEYLTMPWFALLMGCGFWFAWERDHRSAVRFGLSATIRGLVLIALGFACQLIYDQIVVVLQTLGLASVLVGWLVPWLARRVWLAAAAAVVVWLVSPSIIGWAVTARAGADGPLVAGLLDLVASGPFYRAVTMLVWMLLGVAVAGRLRSDGGATTRRLAMEAGALLLVVGAVHLAGRRLTPELLLPYSGTLLETGHNALLALAATVVCVVALRWRPSLGELLRPVADLGRLALTAYVMQLVILRVLTTVFLAGGRDDHWWVLLVTVGLLLAGASVWERLGWPRPVEWLLRASVRPVIGRTGQLPRSPDSVAR